MRKRTEFADPTAIEAVARVDRERFKPRSVQANSENLLNSLYRRREALLTNLEGKSSTRELHQLERQIKRVEFGLVRPGVIG